jgi:hypothetical protein
MAKRTAEIDELFEKSRALLEETLNRLAEAMERSKKFSKEHSSQAQRLAKAIAAQAAGLHLAALLRCRHRPDQAAGVYPTPHPPVDDLAARADGCSRVLT